jgi:hypothetical protein
MTTTQGAGLAATIPAVILESMRNRTAASFDQARTDFRKRPRGNVFDMHALEETLAHVPHISAAEMVQAR